MPPGRSIRFQNQHQATAAPAEDFVGEKDNDFIPAISRQIEIGVVITDLLIAEVPIDYVCS